MRELPGNRHVTARLRKLLERGRVGHAYLFAGPEGVGKLSVALDFAHALAPETIRIGPEEGKVHIAILQIRELIARLSLKSDRPRAVVVEPADGMTEQAMNALLKLLEEPPPGVALLLVTSAPAGLLPTIRSRCQTVLFFPVPEPELREYARSKHGLSGEDLEWAVALAGGSLERADELASSLDEERARLDAPLEKMDRESARKYLRLLAAALRDRLAGRDTPLSRTLPPDVDPLEALEAVLRREIDLGLNAHVELAVENALLRVRP